MLCYNYVRVWLRQNKALLSEDWCAILNAPFFFFLSIGTINTLAYDR